MERVSTILSIMDYRHSLPNIKINDFILDDDGINSPIAENRHNVINEDYYSSDFQSSEDEKQSANKKHKGLIDRGKFTFKNDYHENSDNQSSADDKATITKSMHGLSKQGKSKSLDNSYDSSDEKPTKKTLAPIGLTKRDKLMSRSFDGSLPEKMRSVSFTEQNPNKNSNKVTNENTTVTLLNIKKPLSRTNRSLSESHLHVTNRDSSPKSPSLSHRCPCESRASIFSENQKCHCSCGKPYGSWNSSTKLVLPQIKIQNNGRLSYNRDFCYRVANPRAVIEEAVIKRKGFCSSSSNNFLIKNKARYNKQSRKQSLKKKNSGNKYKQNSEPLAVDASKEFKTVIRTNSDSLHTEKSK